ncbi:Zinc finger HIT domain-containing protein 3 [Paragonimus westermani]|uniref:Zinc finger HIT domain-containing protein 3 n=1 Tax=Paragonimus westermani TaxID=34504 RepID=A0A8T0DPY9_9TREM|nr:Zinc finger HIT domain-containing protein 3 [Paragonimus westermani]
MHPLGCCSVCTLASAIYKCPVCYTKYSCSVSCYKQHKTVGCDPKDRQNSPKTETDSALLFDDTADWNFELEDTGADYVPVRKLELLRNSQQLRNLLGNPHLRRYLENINNSNRPDLAMERAMREPLFIEFADECLRVIQDNR